MNIKDKRPPTSISYTHAQSGLCNDKDKDKRSPAYKGAKFDARGFCLHHEDVRLCRVISHGKFNIVRKICYRCGTSSIARDKKKTKKLHAQKKKSKSPHPQEEVSSKLVSTRTTRDRDRDKGRVNSNEVQRPNQKQEQQTTIKCSKERRRKTVIVTHTHSPVQKNAQVLPRRPLSFSEVVKPKLITAEKIDELRNMMPPPLYQARSNEDVPKKKETQLPFDKHGCCRLHPTRKLAEKTEGGWNIVAGVCPDCCVNAVLQLDLASKQEQFLVPTKKNRTKKSSDDTEAREEHIGKVVRVCDNESQHTYPTANSSISVASYYSGSNLSSPESVAKPSLAFFTQNNKFAGLKISQEGGDVERTLNTSGLSEATHKFKNRLPDPPTLPLFQG